MNIGMFLDTYSPQINGVVTSSKLLKEELTRLGHTVTIVTVKTPEIHEDEENVLRLSSIPFPALPELRIGKPYSNKMMNKIKKLNLDVIHIQTEFSVGIFGRIVAKHLKLPVVHTYHTMYEDYMHYITKGVMKDYAAEVAKKITKIYCSKIDCIIAPTEKTKAALIKYGVKEEIRVIPTGIRISPFKKENFNKNDINNLREKLNIPLDSSVVLFIGRVAKEKSIDVIIKSAPKLIRKISNVKYVIVGDGPENKNLKKLAKKLKVEDSIIFAGKQPRDVISAFYQLGDVFVSASTSETQGLTFIEAMSAELPVVAKFDKNLDGMIQDKENGRMFYNDEELADVLEEVLTNKDENERYKRNAYENVQKYSLKTFGKRVEKVYKDVIKKHRDDDKSV